MKVTIITSSISLLTITWKTWWDLWYLPHRYKREHEAAGENLAAVKKAVQKKRDSAAFTATLAFAIIGICSLTQIGGEIFMNEKVVSYEVFEQKLNKVQNELAGRIERLEILLLDPTGPDGSPGGGILARVESLEEKIKNLSDLMDRNYRILSKEITDNYKITAELERKIKVINNEINSIKRKVINDDQDKNQEMKIFR